MCLIMFYTQNYIIIIRNLLSAIMPLGGYRGGYR